MSPPEHSFALVRNVVCRTVADVFVLELGEDEGGAGYFGEPGGVGGDVLEGGPALGEQSEPFTMITTSS
jgi:hypothetical protein